MIAPDPKTKELCQGLLREMREAADLTQYELAEALGVPQSTISKIEGGERRVDVAELLVLCRVCDVDATSFVATLEERIRGDSDGDPAC